MIIKEMPVQLKKTNYFRWIFHLLGLAIFIGLLHWNSFNAPLERDEGEYSYSAWILSQGIVPYQHSFIQKPPMIIYTYLVSQWLHPDQNWPPRVVALLFIILTAGLLGYVARREWGYGTDLSVIWIFIPMTVFPYLSAFAANTEKFMLLPLVGLVVIYQRAREESNRTLLWFIAGVCSTLTLLYKPIAVVVIIFILFVWLMETWQKSNRITFLLRCLGLYTTGCFLTLDVVIGYFIYHKATRELWEYTVRFNLYYTQLNIFGVDNFFRHLKIFWTNWWILFFLFAWFLIIRPRRWWFYLGLLFCALISVCTSPMGHYYLILMPFWSLICGVALQTIVKKLVPTAGIRQNSVLYFCIAGTVFLMCWPIRAQFTKSPEQLNLWVYGTANPFIESPIVARRVATLAAPTDRVFIAGSEPQILFYAKRLSSSRFVITYPLNANTPWRDKYQTQTIEDLEQQPPTVIVVSRRQFSGLWDENSPPIFLNYLIKLLATKYKLIGGYVWENGHGSWQEPLGANQQPSASLLIYRLQ